MLLATIPAVIDVSALALEYRAYLNTPAGDAEKQKLRADVFIARDHLHISEDLARDVVTEAYKTPLVVTVQAARSSRKIAPRCGQCDRPFDSWAEVWEHERTAHQMESELFAKENN
jgi:hypothetical protein